MKILVACEYSGTVRDAFIRKGHDAVSCDLLPTESPGPHYCGDIRDVLCGDWRTEEWGLEDVQGGLGVTRWDMIIAHPPCTYLCNSGVRWLGDNKERWEQLHEAVYFFKLFLEHFCPKICIENPVPHKYAIQGIGRKYTQTIQPYEFGLPESKRTCLWLKGLPVLEGTKDVKEEWKRLPKKEAQKVHYASPGKDRWKIRSKTYQVFADAMADQWG